MLLPECRRILNNLRAVLRSGDVTIEIGARMGRHNRRWLRLLSDTGRGWSKTDVCANEVKML